MPALVSDFEKAMESIASLACAERWDNVGLLVGSRSAPTTRVLLTIDLTSKVLDEAIGQGVDLICTYHPVMFKPIQRLNDSDAKSETLLRAIRAGIAVYSPHTALDSAAGGLTDWLADAVGQGYRRPLVVAESLPASQELKVVTFAPADAIDRLRDVMSSAGAGRIGAYDHCSFSGPGTGTFRGDASTSPAVGAKERFQRVEEQRLEMVCPASALHVLISTLRQFHPYEEPAVDVYPLRAKPLFNVGGGRKVVLDQPTTVAEIAERIKSHLNIPAVKSTDPTQLVRQVGVVPGSGGDFVETAMSQECELFITGELTYHTALSAWTRGCAVMLTGHANSERGFLPILARRLGEKLDGVEILLSSADRTFFEII
ncbi:MAG: Nif3-like dinuclear metal center hexameric protein [Phycisphaerales bacterium]|nr:Nif3-like dinuclear metal center hexameric protein [Phycisphaerales bacterium]